MSSRVMLKTFTRQSNGIHFCHINVRSLLSCFDEFRSWISDSNVDCVLVTETWLGGHVADELVGILGYSVFRNDRCGRRGGGVAIYLRNGFQAELLSKSDGCTSTEFLFLKLVYNDMCTLLGVVYNPPRVYPKSLFDFLMNESCTFDSIIIGGDFNINLLSSCSKRSMLLSDVDGLGLACVSNDYPTYFCGTTSSLLDFFIVDNLARVSFHNQSSFPSSDHDFIFMTYNLPKPINHPTSYQYRDFGSINHDALLCDFFNLPWENVYYIDDINIKVAIFNDLLTFLFHKHVPLKTVRRRMDKPPWFSNSIERMIAARDMLYRRWKRNRTEENRLLFVRQRNLVTGSIAKAKKQHFDGLLGASNSKELWSQLRKNGIISSRQKNQTNISPDDLNRFFSSAVSGSCPRLPTVCNRRNLSDSFYFRGVSREDIVLAVKSIKSESIGLDFLNTRFIKLMLSYILPYLDHIFNFILTSSDYPDAWKSAKVVPVPKVSSPTQPSDFRPISILPFLSKVLERLMHQQISDYLDSYGLLSANQHGFRKGHSTLTALLKVSEDIRNAMDLDRVTVLVLLDFSKAFDSVDHNLLLHKLESRFGFSLASLSLVKNYITKRCQCVNVNDDLSGSTELLVGVPQGTILGPLLFTMYIDDLSAINLNCNIIEYADDVQLYLSMPKCQICDIIRSVCFDLDRICSWAKCNNLILNPIKTQAIVIYKKDIDVSNFPPIVLDGVVVPYLNKVRNLGVVFNASFTWADHVSMLTSKIFSILRQWWTSCVNMPTRIRKHLVVTSILPLINYCDCLYACMDSATYQRLQQAFNACVRFVFRLRRYDHISPFANDILGMTLAEYLNFRKCVYMFKIINRKTCDHLYDNIKFLNSVRTRNILIPKFKYLQSKNTFFVSAARLWNTLPTKCKTARSEQEFKRIYKANCLNG